jgi:hypothetical protein
MNFAETYSKMPRDELLGLAVVQHSLTDGARLALRAELKARQLSDSDVAEYEKYLSRTKPGELPGKEKFVARSFNGFGTAIYGKRDFLPDGSFVTTKWVVFFWIPILPLSSMRVREIEGGGERWLGWSKNYSIYSKGQPMLKQVLCVYVFVFAFARSWWNFELKPNIINACIIGVLLALPFLLRKIARNRTGQTSST